MDVLKVMIAFCILSAAGILLSYIFAACRMAGKADVEMEKELEKANGGYVLRRCPFCGGFASVESLTCELGWTTYTVECHSCGCKTAPGVEIKDVVVVWNKRV